MIASSSPAAFAAALVDRPLAMSAEGASAALAMLEAPNLSALSSGAGEPTAAGPTPSIGMVSRRSRSTVRSSTAVPGFRPCLASAPAPACEPRFLPPALTRR